MTEDTRQLDKHQPKRRGLFSRHPRFGILVIGVLFLLPICAMVVTVAVIILSQIQNAQ